MFKISICIPTYNGEKFLKEALQSVEQQTYRNFEVIISDNLSCDNTLKIAEQWAFKQDFQVRIFKNDNLGIGKNWNFCINKSVGKYIKFLLQDDVLKPNCLERFIHFTTYQNEIFDLIICKRNTIGEECDYTTEWKSKNLDLQQGFVHDSNGHYIIDKKFLKTPAFYQRATNKFGEPTAMFINRNVFSEIGMYNEEMKQLLDVELYHRYLKKGKILIINEHLVDFRLHDKQATYSNLATSEDERKTYINKTIPLKYFFHLPWMKIIRQKILK